MAAIRAWRPALERTGKSQHQLVGHSSGAQGSWLQGSLEGEDLKARVTTQRLRAQPLGQG